MNLEINGTKIKVENKLSIIELLLKLEKKPEHLAVAINKQFVPKIKYPEYILKEGDAVEIVSPHPGG